MLGIRGWVSPGVVLEAGEGRAGLEVEWVSPLYSKKGRMTTWVDVILGLGFGKSTQSLRIKCPLCAAPELSEPLLLLSESCCCPAQVGPNLGSLGP